MTNPVNPMAFKPGKRILYLGSIFGTPLAIQGVNWLPLNQLVVWGFFTWNSFKKYTSWSKFQHLILGGLQMFVLLGSEWCHNLAHVAAARSVGKPVDAVRILFGMPILLYDQPEHPSVTPRQHIIRSSGGPICNTVLWLICKIFQRSVPAGSPTREIVNTATGMNAFLVSASLVPVPFLDGGPILKWSLIERGAPPAKVTAMITRSQQITGAGLLGSAVIAICKRNWLMAMLMTFLGAISLATGLGKLKY
jgi:Zn-dependent protease